MDTEICRTKAKTSRRTFLKGMAAAGASAALTGCGGGGDSDTYTIGDSGGSVLVPQVEEQIISGTIGNNCGGKCIVRAHVVNGVIKRFTTDETPEGENELIRPQKRACLKCRGKVSEMYKTDRLRYPLKQTGNRGDISGFARIPWQQAFDEIAEKLQQTVNQPYPSTDPNFTDPHFITNSATWGRGTVFAPFGGGPTHALASYNFMSKLASMVGGSVPGGNTAMSYPATNHVDRYTNGTGYGVLITEPNAKLDMFNCQQIVLWGFNPADSIMDTNTTYMLIKAKEQGIPITVVDHNVTRTSKMLGVKHLAPVGGTDPALVCAILYHLIKLQLAESPVTNGKWLDFEYIKKSTHGFFDLPIPTTTDFYGTVGAYSSPTSYPVAAGASFSAFILGNENALVTAGYNSGTSIYPATIGYNVNSAAEAPDGVEDPLYRKRVSIYGQIPKTPEWAEMITGIPAQDIKDFAEMLGSVKRVGIFTGWGSNRTVEAEQIPWAINSLAAVLGCWGAPGKFWGSCHMNISSYSELGGVGALNASVRAISTAALNTAAALTGTNIINKNRANMNKLSFTPTVGGPDGHGRICEWPDMVQNGGSGKSFWNDPIVKYCPPIKVMLLGGFDPVNQTGDNKRSMEIIKDRSKANLVVSLDIFMSPTAQYADYVLPGTMTLEMDSYTSTKTSLFAVPKVIDAPGECLPDYEIAEGIARSINPAYVNDILGSKTGAQMMKAAFDTVAGATDITFEEFKQKGYVDFAEKAREGVNPSFQAYRALIDTGTGTRMNTISGKLEVYSQIIVEDYEARRWYNFDEDASRYGLSASELELGGSGFYTKACNFTNNQNDKPNDPSYGSFSLNIGSAPEIAANMKKARFVYPIPMYIPLIEGCHACDGKDQGDYPAGYPDINTMRHPDPLGIRGEYTLVSGNHHAMKRAHSCGDNNPLATETFKMNGIGGSAFRNPNSGIGTITAGTGFMPAGELGVYEPIDINPEDAAELGLSHGNIIMVSSLRASILACANITNAVRRGVTNMSEGAWSSFMDCNITFADGPSGIFNVDVAGSANSLSTQRPSRISQSSGYGTYQRIKIQKVASVELV
jgi:anaerobic dimethyl sulfoxide reductase subunit A